MAGKGGVGRSTLTAAIGCAGAAAGRRMLIAEIGEPDGPYSPLARLFGSDNFPVDPVALAPHIDGCVLQARRGHQLFMEYVLPMRALAAAALRSKALERMLVAVPSFHEMGVYYHLLTLLRERDGRRPYDCIVLDMPATGHALALTGLPDVLLELMPSGPIATAFREGQAYLNDPVNGGALIVTLPEELPVTESLELMDGLRETRVPVVAVAVNKILEDEFSPDEREAMLALCERESVYGRGRFLGAETGRQAVEALSAGAPGIPQLHIPELPSRGAALTGDIAQLLAGSP